MLGVLARVNGSVRIPKGLFLSYCGILSLIQFTWSGPLRYWNKLED